MRVCVYGPGVCVVDEFEKVLEVLGNANDDVLRGGDGAAFVLFGLHHTLDEAQPVELRMEERGNTASTTSCDVSGQPIVTPCFS